MVVVSEEAVIRRLGDVTTSSQEEIETISLWIMHHKDKVSIEVIVQGWLQAFKNAKSDQQRIALFYIMNDVVQRAKNKHVDILIPAFQPVVITAVAYGKSFDKVRAAMSRCIQIFEDRKVFTSHSVTAMKNLLNSEDSGDGEDHLGDLDNEDVYKRIEGFQMTREKIKEAVDILYGADFNFRRHSSIAGGDRYESYSVFKNNNNGVSALVNLRHSIESSKKKMLELMETVELSKRILANQLIEVTIVEDAYQKFGSGMREVIAEVKEMLETNVYPAATPPRDAPSPTPNDDIYATGVETVLNNLRVPGSRDIIGAMDMDIGDDDDDAMDTGFATNLPPPPIPPPLFNIQPPRMVATNIPPPMPNASFSNPPPIASYKPANIMQDQNGHVMQQWNIPPPTAANGSGAASNLASPIAPPPPFTPGVPPPAFAPNIPPPYLNMSQTASSNIQAILKSIPQLQSRAAQQQQPIASSINTITIQLPSPVEPTTSVAESSEHVNIYAGDVDDRNISEHGMEGTSNEAVDYDARQYYPENTYEANTTRSADRDGYGRDDKKYNGGSRSGNGGGRGSDTYSNRDYDSRSSRSSYGGGGGGGYSREGSSGAFTQRRNSDRFEDPRRGAAYRSGGYHGGRGGGGGGGGGGGYYRGGRGNDHGGGRSQRY